MPPEPRRRAAERRRASVALAASFAVLGFLLVTASSTTRSARRAEAPRRAQLVELIETRREQVTALDRDVRRLRERVDDARRRALQRTRLDRELASEQATLSMLAGTTELRGRGLLVQLSDSDRGRAGSSQEAYRIHDSDIQLVANALFAAGAEAVSVNGNRLVATSAIRRAGDTIVVNFRPLAPPYRVRAIGADRERFERSEIALRFRRWSKLFGLGFSVRGSDGVVVPAYSGRVSIAAAAPAARQ